VALTGTYRRASAVNRIFGLIVWPVASYRWRGREPNELAHVFTRGDTESLLDRAGRGEAADLLT